MEQYTSIVRRHINDKLHYLMVRWDDDINIALVKNDQIWRGVFSQREMEDFYTNLEMSREEYLNHIKKPLVEDCCDEFSFHFSNETLTWKKSIEKFAAMSFVHGKVHLADFSADGGTELLAEALLDMKSCTDEKLKIKDEKLKETSDRLAVALDSFQKAADLKNEMEEALYSKFLSILNSKKKRISKLEEFINSSNIPEFQTKDKIRILEQLQSDSE